MGVKQLQKLTKRALHVFAVLEQYGDGSADPLAALIPFFEPLLSEQDGKFFDPEEFAEMVRKEYRWNFTRDIAEIFCPKFEEKGWIERQTDSLDNLVFKVTCSPKNKTQPANSDNELEERLILIAGEFENFIREISPLDGFARTVEELADILVEWLVSIDAFSEEILEHYSVSAGQNAGGSLSIQVYIPDTSSLHEDERFLAARFVKHLFSVGSPLTEDLCRIASAGLLTEVVQDFHKPTAKVDNSNLCIYLDSPVAMELLGVSGKAAQQNILPIIRELQTIGCSVRVFRISLDEISGALKAVLQNDHLSRTGPTADALRRSETLETYVKDVAQNPRHFLDEGFGVQIDERNLEEFPNEEKYFDKKAYENLFGGMGFHLDPARKKHDCQVIALLMRKRRGHQTKDLFNAKHILVTKNGLLAKYSGRFCRESGITRAQSVGPAIHQRELAAAIWLRTGLATANEEIPKRYLLAACEKVLELKKDLVNLVRSTCSDLSPEQAEQLELLLAQDRSLRYLQDKTLGGVSKIISGSEPDLLIETLRDGLIQEELERSRIDIEREQAERKQAETNVSSLEEQLGIRADEDKLALSQAAASGTRLGRFLRIGALTTIAIFCISYAIYLYHSSPPLDEGSPILQILAFLVFGVIIAPFLAYSQLTTKPLRIDRLVDSCARKRFNMLVRRRGLEQKLERHPIVFKNGKWSWTEDLEEEEKSGETLFD